MPKLVSVMLAALVLMAAVSSTAAPVRCTKDDSPDICTQKFFDGAASKKERKEMAQGAMPKAREEMARNPADPKTLQSGVDTAGQSASSTAEDFVSALSFLGLVNTEEGDESGTLEIDFNRLLPSGIQRLGGKLQGILNTEPTLFDGLAPALPDETREEIVGRLEKESSKLTDLSLSLSINFLGKHLGRDLKAWRLQYASLLSEAIDQAIAEQDRDAPTAGEWLLKNHRRFSIQEGDEKTSFKDLAERAGESVETTIEDFEAWLLAEATLDEQIEKISQLVAHDAFPSLLNNQPQLFASVDWRIRDDLVGPDEKSLKLTFEKPLAPSLNKLRKECPTATADKPFLSCYGTYVKNKKEALERSHRLSFSAQYMEVRDFTIDLPDDGFSKTFEGGHKLIGSFGWGRQFEADEGGQALSKFDLMVSYEDISDPNPDLRVDDRWLATLTFTRKINGMTIPFAIVYSNKSEFLAMQDLDEMISAHVGVKFSVDSKE